jgi:DNA repair photolyase
LLLCAAAVVARKADTGMEQQAPVRTALVSGAFANLKGRGARSNRESRYAGAIHEVDPEFLEHERTCGDARALRQESDRGHAGDGTPGNPAAEVPSTRLRTTVTMETARSIISRNQSPDIPFDRSVNPYRGCEHGCVYCYARPTHAYLGLSPGIDFETRLYAKTNAGRQLDAELRKPGYQAGILALGANTDPYQPIEERQRITRSVLETLAAFRHPVTITTKSALVLRDLDILQDLARHNLVRVQFSVATLDRSIARTLEPRASTPARRLEALRTLAQAGVPTGVIVAPLIPALTDPDLEHVLEAAAAAGATHASFSVLRLPLEVRDLFKEWLREFAPLRAERIMSLVRQMRDGADYRSDFATRMRGTGIYARLLQQRFTLACKRLHLAHERETLDATRFRVPDTAGAQGCLF